MKVSRVIERITEMVTKDMHTLNMDVQIRGNYISFEEIGDSKAYEHWEEVENREGDERRTENTQKVSVEIQGP